ncbi:MAG TPA: hypothetical protein VNN22_19785 [Verrucomicrobiae bacterium]|nr:hypothetical protein [Verrucomicrobiae bacterium]
MNATVTDDRRRLVMPPELPARSAVTVQQIDEDTWIVKRHKPDKEFIVVLFPDVPHLPDDPEWEATERRIVEHNNKNLPPFEV